jgi:flavin-dependent dehydrogenase
VTAGAAVERHLQLSCRGVRDALRDAERDGSWLSVGPLRPGIRLNETAGVFRVGNAAGEAHPLIGEGITMALQSSHLLVDCLKGEGPEMTDARRLIYIQRVYAQAWRRAFASRLRLAAGYAHIAMRPLLAAPTRKLARRWPILLTEAARFAGKARHAVRIST